MSYPNNIYDAIEQLENEMTGVLTDIESLKAAAITDTGWLTLPLAEGICDYGGSTPQYRKIGNVVFVRGAVQNVLDKNTVVAALPEGCRPSVSHNYIQNTSMRPSYLGMNARLAVKSNGDIVVETISDGACYGEDKWFPLHTDFAIG